MYLYLIYYYPQQTRCHFPLTPETLKEDLLASCSVSGSEQKKSEKWFPHNLTSRSRLALTPSFDFLARDQPGLTPIVALGLF